MKHSNSQKNLTHQIGGPASGHDLRWCLYTAYALYETKKLQKSRHIPTTMSLELRFRELQKFTIANIFRSAVIPQVR